MDMAALLIGLGIVLLILLICRELTLWYFKVNKHLDKQDEIISLLKDIRINTKKDNPIPDIKPKDKEEIRKFVEGLK